MSKMLFINKHIAYSPFLDLGIESRHTAKWACKYLNILSNNKGPIRSLLLNYFFAAAFRCWPILKNQLFYFIIVARKPKNPV